MVMDKVRRPHRPDDHDMHELVLSALVDLNLAATAMDKQAQAIASLATGLSPAGILHATTRTLDTNGQRTIEQHVPAASVAVMNFGTAILTVSTTGGGSAAAPGVGPGTIKLFPGEVICLPLIGTSHNFWGRPGELFSFVAYKTVQPFMASRLGGAYFTPNLNLSTLVVGPATIIYTTPQGDNAYYGGIAVADTLGPAGTADVSELIITDGNGVELDRINLAGKESTEDLSDRPIAATSPSIRATLVKGAVAGTIRVW
jgi:hypothetical protein